MIKTAAIVVFALKISNAPLRLCSTCKDTNIYLWIRKEIFYVDNEKNFFEHPISDFDSWGDSFRENRQNSLSLAAKSFLRVALSYN